MRNGRQRAVFLERDPYAKIGAFINNGERLGFDAESDSSIADIDDCLGYDFKLRSSTGFNIAVGIAEGDDVWG